jgi:hypothetical protein
MRNGDCLLPVPSEAENVAAATQSAALEVVSPKKHGYDLLWREEATAIVAHVRGFKIRFFEAAIMHNHAVD